MQKQKQISPDSLLEIIEGSLAYKQTDSYGSLTPKGTVFHGFIERSSTKTTQVYVLERESCIRSYNHFGEIYKVGYPKLLFIYLIEGDKIVESALMAVKDEMISKHSGVFVFPYANVFGDGRICWGSYRHPKLNDVVMLTYAPEAFYTIEHTHNTNAKGQVVKELLDQMKEKQFDDNLLIFDTTFEKFINRFTKVEIKL